MERWIGRVALVTGASAGIGAAICKELVAAGMVVVGAARGVEKVEALSKELSDLPGTLVPFRCDLTKDSDIMEMFSFIKKKHKGVDVCINNAGLAHKGRLMDGKPEEWREALDVNVVALCLCTREALKSMKERNVDDGYIFHISSMSGHRISPNSTANFYCATKFAVTALTEGLRQELRAMNSHIRVTAISPGLVETEFAARMTKDPAKAKELYSSLPCLQPEDIVSSVIHALTSPLHVQIHDILLRPTEQIG